jgi:hypothetical protein
LGLLILSVVLALVVPSPTATQQVVFRVVLCLAAGGVAAAVPGDLHLEGKIVGIQIDAAGGLGIFVLTYLVSPKVFGGAGRAPGRAKGRTARAD